MSMKFQTFLLLNVFVLHAGLPAALGHPDKPPKPEAVEAYDQGRRLLESGVQYEDIEQEECLEFHGGIR